MDQSSVFSSKRDDSLQTKEILQRLALILVLAAFAYAGNSLSFTITFGTHFRFGGIASIVAALTLGWPSAAVVAVIGSFAIPDWVHQFGYTLLAVSEAVFVAMTYRRFWHNAIVATTIFWVLPGAIISGVVSAFRSQINLQGFLLVWSTQCINSILNALIASAGLIAVSLLRQPTIKIRFQEAFFNTLVALIFLPILAIVIFASQIQLQGIVSDIQKDTMDQAKNVVQFLEMWKERNFHTIKALAAAAAWRGVENSSLLQQDIYLIHKTNPSFHDMFVADADAVTVGFDPPKGPQGESLIGLSFVDRQYYWDVMRTRQPLVSDVILGRGGINFPIVCFVVPILSQKQSDKILGFALGSFNVHRLAENIKVLISDPSFKVTLSDTDGTVITSTDPSITPLTPIANYFSSDQHTTSFKSLRSQLLSSVTPTTETLWRERRYGSMLVEPALGWAVYVETDLQRYTHNTTTSIIQIFCEMLALTVGGVGLSLLIIMWVNRPVASLAEITTEIAKQPLRPLPNLWPWSRFVEVATLVQNFAYMTVSLRDKFKELNNEIDKHKSTEQKLQEAMKKAQAANVAKSEFLANMSHEIRTPLAAIKGYTELLKLHRGSDQENAAAIDSILRNSKQLSELVNDILDLSRIEAGHLKLDPSWVSIDEVLASGVEALGCRAKDKGLALEIVGKGRFPARIYVDPTRLNQILLNVVGNAIKFTNKGKVAVAIAIEPDTDSTDRATFLVLVEDSGVGIAPEHQEKLFKPFVQADATYARRFGGTGLGLALSRNIASALQGSVNLIRSTPGSGSTFEIKVQVGIDPQQELYPNLTAARAALRKPVSKSTQNHALSGKKILLVDDAPDNRALVNRVLTIQGATVTTAESGQEALDHCVNDTWDVILMDMQMPIMDGFQATRELRARGYQRPIIALTAHALPEERAQCFAAGCNDHVTKPIDWDQLVDVILRWDRRPG